MSKLRDALHQAADLICDAIEQNGAADWVDQNTSPLGKKKHLALARSGAIKFTREGRQVLMRRADIDAYLEKRRSGPGLAGADLERDVAHVLAFVGRSTGKSA